MTSIEFRELYGCAVRSTKTSNHQDSSNFISFLQKMATPAAQPCQSSEDWQTTKATVRDRTAFLFNNSLLSDINFVVTDSQDESDSRQFRIPVHKFVLAISSPVFEAMFYGQLAEKGEEVELPDTDSHTLLEFLRFVYCDEVNLTIGNVLGVLYVAKKYIVPTLAAKCRSFLETKLDETNVFQILEEAKKFEESQLENRCWELIDANTTTFLRSDGVLTLRHDTLVSLLKRENLCAEEVHIFDAVKCWAKAKCEENGLEPSGEALREILGNAVDFIRFPVMSQKEFAHHVVPTGILASEDALEVYQFLSGVTPATEMKLSCTKREGIFSKSPILRCGRYAIGTTSSSSERFNELTDNLTFQTDKDIYFRGVRLYAGASKGQNIRADVRILTDKNGAELTAEEGTFIIGSTFSGSSRYTYGFDVLFKFAVQIGALSKYRIHVTVKGIDGEEVRFNNIDPITTANVSDVHFTFEGTSRQILELLFHTVN